MLNKIIYKIRKNRINKTKKENLLRSLEKAMAEWEWLSDNPDKSKEDYFKRNKNYPELEVPHNYCYICESLVRKRKWYEDDYYLDDPVCDCQYCPLMWTLDGKGTCMDKGSPYKEWCDAINAEEKSKAALKVYRLIEATYCSLKK